jgi:cystathionine beta-lyase
MPDLRNLIQAAKAVGAWTAIDNTWSAGLAYQPFSHGIDISLQALTKYQSGGADVLMGAVLTQDHDLHLKLKYAHMRLGLGVGADDAWLVLRGLPTLRLRYEQHDRVTRALAQWMKTLPVFEQVLHPALPDSPGHEYWQRDFSAAGGLVSVVFPGEVGQARVDAFVDALQVFRIGYSWGGPVSLAVPYDPATLRRHGSWQPGQSLVRFCIGLESFEDLRADIEQALVSAGLNQLNPPSHPGT